MNKTFFLDLTHVNKCQTVSKISWHHIKQGKRTLGANKIAMEIIKENNLFCEKCFLHFDTKSIYNIHLSFVHQKGRNIMQLKLVDIKNEYEDLIHHSNISKPNKNLEKSRRKEMYTSVQFVITAFLENTIWIDIFYQFTRKRSNTSAQFVITAFLKNI